MVLLTRWKIIVQRENRSQLVLGFIQEVEGLKRDAWGERASKYSDNKCILQRSRIIDISGDNTH